MEKTAIIILAAGQGKRMGSERPKVLSRTSACTLLDHVLDTSILLSPEKVVVVTGYKNELVEASVKENPDYKESLIEFAKQEQQLGTGDAVKSALTKLQDFTGNILILYGDVPLIKPETLKVFLEKHAEKNATLSLISATTDSPSSYGRIIRDNDGQVSSIKEARDCSQNEYLVNEINTGIYVVDSAFLTPAVNGLEANNAQKELYLTDIVEKAVTEGQTVECHILPNIIEAQGVNTNYDLQLVSQELSRRTTEKFSVIGVQFEDTNTFYSEDSCKIEKGVKIGPNVTLRGNTHIESGVIIEGTCYLKNCKIKKGALLKFGVRAEDTVIGEESSVGPFANLRPGTIIDKSCKVGNFVEIKNSHLHDGAKASHLSYLGDADVGKDANIGAGTITCNYDGYKKSKTKIGDNVFIGSNSSLVAPVKINNGATVGAGSTITKEITSDALALTRAPQREIKEWSKKKREQNLSK